MGRGVATSWQARVRSVLGPWPFEPGATALTFFALYGAFFIGVYASELRLPLFTAFMSGAAALVVYGLLKLLRRIQDRIGPTWWLTAIAVVGIWVITQAFRAIFGFGFLAQDRILLPFLPTFIRGGIATFVFITVIGYVSHRLRRETLQAQQALKLAREQQVQIIAADEDAKRQAALLLHDKVQAGLIASCLELQSFAQSASAEQRERLLPVIARLEHMRSIDVGSAARVLSPNLVDIDLTTTLEELAAQYTQVVDIVVDVDEQIDREYGVIDENVLLGAYRIIEQALMNAVKHAKPSRIWVSVVMQDEELVVQVSDDGVGLPAEVKPGIGTTIITTWTRALDGQWRTERGPVSRGTTLIAVLPIAQLS